MKNRAGFIESADAAAPVTTFERLADSRSAWLVLACAAMALRLGFALLAPHVDALSGVVAFGSDGYEKIAANLLDGNGYRIRNDVAPTMLRNPGYVLVVAGAFAAFGRDKLVGIVLQALTAGAITLLIRPVGCRMAGRQAAFLGAIMYALYPPDWLASAKYIAEPLMGVLILLMLLAADAVIRRPSVVTALLLGALGGALVLTKSVGVLLLPCLLVALVLISPEQRRNPLRTASLGFVALALQVALLVPWGAYNYERSGRFVLTSTIAGWALFDSHFIANYEGPEVSPTRLWLEARKSARAIAAENGIFPDPRDDWAFTFADIHDEIAMGDLLKRRAVEGIEAAPLRFAGGMLRRSAEFWYAGRSDTSTLIGAAINLPICAVALWGFWRRALYRSPLALIGLAVIVYMNGITALSFAVARYSIPVMPIVLVFAASSFVQRRETASVETLAPSRLAHV